MKRGRRRGGGPAVVSRRLGAGRPAKKVGNRLQLVYNGALSPRQDIHPREYFRRSSAWCGRPSGLTFRNRNEIEIEKSARAEENDATVGEARGAKTRNTEAGGTTARDTRGGGQPARETRNEDQRATETRRSERERSQGQQRTNGRTGERHRALDHAHS